MSSIQKHREHFARTPQINIQRSTFDTSQGTKTTFDPGKIIPLKCIEIVPGDTHKLRTAAFVRMITPIAPYMDNLYMDFFAFFVPNRLVWENWQKFMGEQENPGDSTDFTIPQVSPINTQTGTLWDYYGIPYSQATESIPVNALPFRGYNLIFNEWFRDQDLVDSVPVHKDNGPDPVDSANYSVLRRMKRHDYFTSARPWPQKGPDVLIPGSSEAGARAQVYGDSQSAQLKLGPAGASANILGTTSGNSLGWNGAPITSATTMYFPQKTDPGHTGLMVDDISDLLGTINQLRQAEAVQVLLERDARGGTRYIEMLKSQYGVTNPDFRLQRPELVGQGQLRVSTNPVPQTSSTDETTPQGNLAAFSVASGSDAFAFTHSFTEHGYLHIFCSVRADLNYQQGLHRMWSRKKRFDFYVPALAHLGEQAILNKEILWRNPGLNPTWNDGVFGYQEAWADYRYGYNNITGDFRTENPSNLGQWHLAQQFDRGTGVFLDESFIVENPPIDRILAVEPSDNAFFGDFWFDIQSTRPMPVYSIPGWSSNL